MQSAPKAASRFVAALWFWLVPSLGVSAYEAMRIFVFEGEAYFGGPTGTITMTSIFASVLSTANVLGFLAAAHLCPRVCRQNANLLYLLSVVVGFVCFFSFYLIDRLTDSIWLSLVGSVLASALISFASLRAALTIGLLRQLSTTSVCTECGYDLRGSGGLQCPECGSQRADRQET